MVVLVSPIVCQMLSWRTKNWPHFINISDTVTNVIPLHSVHQAPSYEPNLTLLAWFLRDLAYLSMLFILEVVCTACSYSCNASVGEKLLEYSFLRFPLTLDVLTFWAAFVFCTSWFVPPVCSWRELMLFSANHFMPILQLAEFQSICHMRQYFLGSAVAFHLFF